MNFTGQSYKNISKAILNYDLKSFLDLYLEQDITKITLQLSNTYKDDFALLAEQLKLYKKAKIKFPSFANAYCFFTTKSFEQASSESAAKFKATLFKGSKILDLSGGLGVDDWAFSNSFKQVISVDRDEYLNQIVRRNFELLHINNIDRLDADANDFIKNDAKYDLVYLDADRRPEIKNKRVFDLLNSEPNILQLKKRLFELTDTILLKLSSMLDISALFNELVDISEVYVVSVNNEVKELLVVLEKEFLQQQIHAVNLENDRVESYTSKRNLKSEISYSDEGAFFYEPSLALIKSGIAQNYANDKGMKMLAPNSYFFLTNSLVNDFFGRSFKVIAKIDFSKSNVKKYLSQNGIVKANISKRNFPVTVNEIKKTFSISDGGEEYLFFTENNSKQRLLFHCRKMN